MKYASLKIILLLFGVSVFGILGCADSSSPGTSGPTYFYSNWSCGNQSQCIAVMGHNVGSAGPFCVSSSCQAWNRQYIPGASSCNATAVYPIYNYPTGRACQ